MHAPRTVFSGLFVALLSLAACHSDSNAPRRNQRPAPAPPGPATGPTPSQPSAPLPATTVTDAEVDAEAETDAGPPVEGCIHEHGGCRQRVRRLPECPTDIGAMAVSDVVTNRLRMVRQRVSVFGRLGTLNTAGVCTERGCPPTNRCCNRCGTEMVVAASAEPNAPRLQLRDPDHEDTYSCQGDVSEMCCPYAQSTNVVVQGTVVAPTAGHTLYTLLNPTICEIVHPRVPAIPTAPDAAVSQ